MLRVALHVSVAASLAAGPPAVVADRTYGGVDGVPAVLSAPEPPTEPGPKEDAAIEAPAAETPSTEVLPASPGKVGPAPAEPAPATATPEGPVDDDADEAIPYDPLVDSPEAIRARSWVRSGAVLTTVGGALAIGGIAMATAKVNTPEMQNVCNPRQDPAGNGCQEEGRDRAALALGIPGALLLAGGIAMLIVGKLQQRRLRADLRLGLREVGVGLRLHF